MAGYAVLLVGPLYSAAVNIWGSRVLPHTNIASGNSPYRTTIVANRADILRHFTYRRPRGNHDCTWSNGTQT